MSFQKKSYAEALESFHPLKRKRMPRTATAAPVRPSGGSLPVSPRKGLKRSHVSKAARNKRFQVLRADTIWSQAVRARDNHRCRRCKKRDEHGNHAHHAAPRSRRSDLKRVMDNGITVCPECHRWIHDNPVEAIAAGLLSDRTRELAKAEGTLGIR